MEADHDGVGIDTRRVVAGDGAGATGNDGLGDAGTAADQHALTRLDERRRGDRRRQHVTARRDADRRQRFERDRGLKIDFVVASPALASRVTGAFIDRDERDPARGTGSPSDHAPVVVDLS